MEDITVEPRGRRRLYGDPGPAVKVKNMSRNPAKSVRCHSSATEHIAQPTHSSNIQQLFNFFFCRLKQGNHKRVDKYPSYLRRRFYDDIEI